MKKADIIVFAPHIDDETIGAGEKIIQKVKEKKNKHKIK